MVIALSDMDGWFDILMVTLPSLVMLAVVCVMVGGYFRSCARRKKEKLARGNQALVTPLRLQAYERLVLLLERISPEALVLRASYPAKTCRELHAELLQTIRAEFEYNLSQQLYVSTEVWASVCNVKNYVVALINTVFKGVEGDAPAIEMSRKIMDMTNNMEQPVIEKALHDIKQEMQQFF
jgi:hypothetical protein